MKDHSHATRFIVIPLSALLTFGISLGCGNIDVDATSPSSVIVESPPNPNYLATIKIGSTPGRAISPTFMGLSHEWDQAPLMMGDSTVGVNLIYRQLIKNLMAYGSGPLIIRVGGNSTDKSGEPSQTIAQPFAELASALGVHFYLGVNLGSDDVDLAAHQARAFASQMPPGYLDAIEIGNEPDGYSTNGMRPASYSLQDYLGEFNVWRSHLVPLLRSGTLLLGTSGSSPAILALAPTFVRDELGVLAAFSHHYYVGSSQVLTEPDSLLSPSLATSGPTAVAASVTRVHEVGLPFRMAELGSFYDYPTSGANNDFESALWGIDIMFEYANVGVDGVNWDFNNGGGLSGFAFDIKTTKAGTIYSLNLVRPIYYGLVFFQEAIEKNAHLLPVTLCTGANLKAWATTDAFSTPHLVLINKDEFSAGTVKVTITGYTRAKVMRLTAPSYLSTKGVTLAGQTFDGSTDGRIQGTQSVESYKAVGGVFSIPMPLTSAALVVFSN